MRDTGDVRDVRARLLAARRPSVRRLVRRWPHMLPELAVLEGRRWCGRPLLEITQRTIDCLASGHEPERSASDAEAPWWGESPAATLAAVFRHTGLVPRRREEGANETALLPHARESSMLCRRALARIGVPFEVRWHAAMLLDRVRAPDELVGSDVPEETWLKLACTLDMRALYRLRRAELEAKSPGSCGKFEERAEEFAETCRRLSVFGSPPAVPLGRDKLRGAGLEGVELHRAANALRYFRLCQRRSDPTWLLGRMHEEMDMPRGHLHLVVGPAGCGKSTWARRHLGHTRIISTDRVREELTGDPEDQSCNHQVFNLCSERLIQALGQGGEVTFDATNYCEELRETPVLAARHTGARISSSVFDVGLEEALARNSTRQRRVPPEVIHRHWSLLRPPALYEADRHCVVSERGSVRRYWPVSVD